MPFTRPQTSSLLAVLGGLLALPTLADTSAAERIEWTRTPIQVELKVNAETQIQFPAPVKVGLPGTLRTELRTQSVGDVVYLKPATAFESTRLIVQTRDGAHTYLLDVSSSETAQSPRALRIIDRDAEPPADEPMREGAHAQPQDPVTLTRFAAQQLYAPRRFLQPAPGVVREPVSEAAVDLVRGGAVTARPLIAWRTGRLHVTAVKLVNADATARDLDPRELRGEWLTATFQHNRVLAAGDEADTTVVYLVSDRPFALAL